MASKTKRLLEVLQQPTQVFGILRRRYHLYTNKIAESARRIYLQSYQQIYSLPAISIDNIASPQPESVKHITYKSCMPPYHGWWKHDDLTPLIRLLCEKRPRQVLEFGTAFGNLTANVCAATEASVITVNALPEQISGEIQTYQDPLTKEQIGKAYRKYKFDNRVKQIYTNTLDWNPENDLEPNSLDFVIIDACHDTPYVINDFEKCLPFVKEDAWIVFHDTHPSMEGHLAGSYHACMKLRRRGHNIQYIKGTWWGILRLGQD